MADIKLSGHADLAKLLARKRTWEPPKSLGEYLTLMGQVVLTSRYKDMFKELDPRDLQGILRVKAHRCLRDGELDLEEVVDVGAYAGLLFMRMKPEALPEAGVTVRKVGPTVEVGTSGQLEQVNKPKPVLPVKTENRGLLVGMKCPKCGSLAPFDLRVEATARLSDERMEQFWQLLWKETAKCVCVKCAYTARVRDFFTDRPQKEKGKKRGRTKA